MNTAIGRYFWKTLRIISLLAIIILGIRSFVVEPTVVNGRSMEDTFLDSQVVLINKFTLLFREPRRGDVVQIYDAERNTFLLKRIIGLPGERVKISEGSVFIIDGSGNEQHLDEPYLKPYTFTQSRSHDTTIYDVIPKYSYFVLGDNRSASIDSREYGAIQRSAITGLATSWPF